MQFFADGFQLKEYRMQNVSNSSPHEKFIRLLRGSSRLEHEKRKSPARSKANDGASAGCSAASRGWCARAGRLREKEHEVLREYPTQVLGPNLTQE